MGALIASAAPRRLRAPEEANLVAPEIVVSVHVAYIQAGAELIETNTFGANRAKLGALYLDDDVARINSEAVKLAREAREMSGADVLIAGSIGPLGDGAIVVDRAASTPSRRRLSTREASTSSRWRRSTSWTSCRPRSRRCAASRACRSSR